MWYEQIIEDENSAQKFPDLDNAWPLPWNQNMRFQWV